MRKLFFSLTTAILLTLPLVLVSAIEIENPLQYDTIEGLINAIINWLFALALVLVPLVIVVAGYFFVNSQGDPAKVTQARNMVIYALVGLLIIMISKGIIALIRRIIGV